MSSRRSHRGPSTFGSQQGKGRVAKRALTETRGPARRMTQGHLLVPRSPLVAWATTAELLLPLGVTDSRAWRQRGRGTGHRPLSPMWCQPSEGDSEPPWQGFDAH